MKVLSVVAFLVLSSTAFAALKTPLLVKSSGSGFTPPEHRRGETCEVFEDGVVIRRIYGTTQVVEKLNVTVSESIKEQIIAASKAEIVAKDNTLCDGPSTSIVANLVSVDDRILLYATGGCGSPRKTRQGTAASMLTAIVDTYCPKTFKVGE